MTTARRYASVILIAALLLRAGWVLACWSPSGPVLSFDDERLHWQLAANLFEHGTLVTDDGRRAARMPLYPLYLALFAPFGDWGILAARLGQAVLGAAGVGVAWWWGSRFAGRNGALLAATLVCVDPFGIFFCNLLLTEALFTPVALALSAACWRLATWQDPRRIPARLGIAISALSAAAVLTRPESLLWIVALAITVFLCAKRRAAAVRHLATAAVVTLAALAAWGLRNQAVLGSFVWLSTNGGVTLYDGHRPGADGGSDQSLLKHLPELRKMNEVQRDAYLARAATQRIASDPVKALRLAGWKLMRTWNPIPNYVEYRGGWAAWVSALYTLTVLGLGLAGTLRPADRCALLTAWLPVILFTALSCLFVGSLRYRVPLMPFVCVAAAGIGRAGSAPDLGHKRPDDPGER